MPLGMVWRDTVHEAFIRIGGSGSLADVYASVEAMFAAAGLEAEPPTWRAIVRREIEYNSSDSESYKGRADLFRSTKGLGAGFWALRTIDVIAEPMEEVDLGDEAARRQTYISRVVRDSRKVRALKALHADTCQLCRTTMIFPDGTTYSEVHHLKPLGRPHNGPDREENMLVVCPNCHVLLDFGARPINPEEIAGSEHEVSANYLDYSNSLTRWVGEPIE